MSLMIEHSGLMKAVGPSMVGDPQGLSPDVLKAVTVGAYAGGVDPYSAQHPLIAQSLDPIIWALTMRAPYHTPFLNSLRSKNAKALLEEFDRLTSLGDSGSFFEEGGLPREATSTYERAMARVKFMGQMGIVTGPAAAAIGNSNFGTAKAREMFARTQRLLLDTEEALWHGSSDLMSYAFDGFFHQMFDYAVANSVWDTMVIDLQGKPLDPQYIDQAIMSVWDVSHGEVDKIWTSARDKQYIDFLQQPYRRVQTGGDTVDVTRNIIATKTHTAFGDVDHYFNKFLAAPRAARALGSSLIESGAPATGTVINGNIVGAGNVTNSDSALTNYLTEWPFRRGEAVTATPAAGTYYYWVAPINEYGEGYAKQTATAGTVVTATKVVTLTFTPVAYGTEVSGAASSAARGVTKAFAVYRGTVDDLSKAKLLAYFPRKAYNGSTAEVIVDDGTFIPGTTKAAIMRDEVQSLRYLLNPVTYDLAKIDDRERWMHVQYLTLINHVPIHNRVFINIGEPPAVGAV